MKVKNNIKQHRARMNLTQDGLAKKTGVSRQSISAIEKGIQYPSILLSLQIAKALEMGLDNLFELIKEEKKEKVVQESFIQRIQKSRFDK